jgi:hypothetical protein
VHNETAPLISAIVLAILAMLTFYLQLAGGYFTTATEKALINILQFTLSIAFTWQAARFFGYKSFATSLRKYAIGAYRRISDIDNIISRLNRRIMQMMVDSPSRDDTRDLRLVREIVLDAQQIIVSSGADWSDVIEEEISALKSIKELDAKRAALESSLTTENGQGPLQPTIDQLTIEIEQLRNSLPIELRYGTDNDVVFESSLALAASWLMRRHVRDDGLVLSAVTGLDHGNFDDALSLTPGDLANTSPLDSGVDVYSSTGSKLGRLLNETPFDYPLFTILLHQVYGTDSLTLEFVRIASKWERDGVPMARIEFRVKDAPKLGQESEEP